MKTSHSASWSKLGLRILLAGAILLSLIIASAPENKVSAALPSDLIITGVIDGPLTGGVPKAIELYVINDIPDLSIYGVSSANNGGGATGAPEYTFPAVAASAGEFIYFATESTAFSAFFGFAPDYTDSTVPAINGDDAVELFMYGAVVDVFGDVAVDGTGTAWDYVDGWAYRLDETGPDGSTFVLANWSFSGIDALDGESTNDTATTPFPLGTYSPAGAGDVLPTVASTTPADSATDIALDSNIVIDFSEAVTVDTDWYDITCATSGAHTALVTGGPASYTLDPDADFSNSESCTVTITAAAVADQDGTVDNMAADYIFSFTTVDPTPFSVVINELRIDHDGTDTDEYFELKGTPDGSLDGFAYIVIGDGTGGSGVVESVTDLTGSVMGSDGLFVAATATFTLTTPDLVAGLIFENSDNVTHMLVKDFTGVLGDDLDTNDDGTFDVTPWSEIVDSVALIETTDVPTSGEYYYSPNVVGPDGTFVPGHAFYCPPMWMIGEFSIPEIGGTDTPGAENACPVVIINEVDADTAGTDVAEFVELFDGGVGNFPLDGLSVVLFNGSSDTSYAAFDLDTYTTDENGYFVICGNSANVPNCDLDVTPDSDLIQNGADAVALYEDDAANFPTGTAVTVVNLVDALVYDTSDADDAGLLVLLNPGQPQVNEGENANSAGESNQRCPNGDGGERNTDTYQQWAPTAGLENACAVISQCGEPATFLHDVQGPGATSPLAGSSVTVEAVVIADYQGTTELSGFFLQEEDADVDADPLTSEGVFVYYTGVDVNVGDVVRVTGTAAEYSDSTQIGTITGLEVCSTGNAAPVATVLALPNVSDTALEAVEGMLVQYTETLYVTETYNLGRYGEVHLSGTAPLDLPTNVAEPGVDSEAVDAANNLNRILLDDASSVQNPPVVEHLRSTGETLRIGDTVTGLTGVLNQGFGYYRIQPLADVVFTPASVRPAAAPEVGGTLKVASFNVLNYFTTLGSRGANTITEFTRQRDKIIVAIITLDADVVGLMEIENNGYGDETSAIDDLVDGLNDIAGAGTYAYIDPGVPVIGTDEIAVGLLYKPASVTPVGTTAILDSTFDPLFDDASNRPALTQSFTEIATGETFTVIVNHLKSKGSECGIGDDDPIQGNCNLTRTNAATALVSWAASDPTGIGDPDVLIIGDLNAYAMEDPVDVIKAGLDDTAATGDDFTDLVDAFGGTESLYSYIFDGERGYLDHALSSATLTYQVTGTAHWHINSDEPRILDYNTEFGQEALALYVADQYRSSDHDPVVIGLSLASDLATPTLISPAHNEVVENMDVTYTWNKVAGADQYTLEIKTVDSNTLVWKAYYDAAERCDDTTCSVTVPDGLALERHKWHVRAWAGTTGSDWSLWDAFEVTLSQVQLRSPGVDAIVYGGRPTFKWYPVDYALSYIIEFYDSTDTLITSWQKSPECELYCEFRVVDDLGANYGDYKWRILAKNSGIEGAWSDMRIFTYTQLERTTQISPEDGFSTDDTTPTLQWADITGATMYLLQIRDLSDNLILQALVSDELYCDGATCTWDVDPALEVGQYVWHVRAKNGRNFGLWTPYRAIEIVPAP